MRGLDLYFLLSDTEITQRRRANADFCEYFASLAAERQARPRHDLINVRVTVP